MSMSIKEVCEKFDITPDTLRYYERIGVIPEVERTPGGTRRYDVEAIGWVNNAVCMRKAGVSVEAIAEYVRLYRMGDETLQARLDLLSGEREKLLRQQEELKATIELLNYKISRYEEAVITGVLSWDKKEGETE